MAELFSEIYNCYFQVVKALIEKGNSISKKEAEYKVRDMGFEESIFTLMPKLLTDEWGFFEPVGDTFESRLSKDFFVPLSNLQKAYIKSILLDEKIKLFLSDNQINELNAALAHIEPLYKPDTFYYFDRYTDKDDYENPLYRKNFQVILEAIKNHRYVNILYKPNKSREKSHCCLPCRIEYSVKNDRFRLLAFNTHSTQNPKILQLNLNRMLEVTLSDTAVAKVPDINHVIRRSYYKEPVRIIIKNERNALERAMLQFANYDKHTKKISENTYECLIYYNKSMETELLIEILSFGPMIKVVGNEDFLNQLKKRISKQYRQEF